VPRVEADGTIHASKFDLPESSYLSAESRAALKRMRDVYSKDFARMSVYKDCPSSDGTDNAAMPAVRKCLAEAFYETSFYQNVINRYDIIVKPEMMGGVYTEVFTPVGGVADKNKERVLINIHGGGFNSGSRTLSHLESIPIASEGGIKVISVDYRLAPEHKFPAATEDVVAVYETLLKQYKPNNIGIYGCSAGGRIVAQAIAKLQQKDLPSPGAAGIFCAGAYTALDKSQLKTLRSDSIFIFGALNGFDLTNLPPNPYFKDVDYSNSLFSPGSYDNIMAEFPPTLLITGTRDYVLSSTIYTHSQLSRLGVEADLHVWEGMGNGFHYNPELPESREAYSVIVKFFDRYLGGN